MNKKRLLTSLMSIAMLASITTGATYALFTAEDTANIAITSAKVKVEAKVLEDFAIKSLDTELTNVSGSGTFSTGGTATISNGDIKLDKMTPGDKVEFDIKVTNSSNIDIKYKLKWSVDGKLGEALVAKTDDEELENLPWTLWEADAAEKEFVIKMSIELPVEVGNEYKETSCDIKFTVAAIQSNGLLVNYVTPETIDDALAVAQVGDEIQLAAGYYDEIKVPQNEMKFYSNEGAEVGFLNVNGKENVTLQGLTFDAAGAKYAQDGNGDNKQYTTLALASGKENNKGARDLVVDGCTFEGEFANGGTAIAFVDKSRTSGQSGNITIKNCEFATTNAYYDIYCHYSGLGSLLIENNKFASDCLGLPIYLGRYQSSTPVVLKGNTFTKVSKLEEAAYIQDHSDYGVSIDDSNNTFN